MNDPAPPIETELELHPHQQLFLLKYAYEQPRRSWWRGIVQILHILLQKLTWRGS